MFHENLKGRVAVITGGGGVLCSGFAKDLAALGVKVAVLDLREEAAQVVVDEITAAGGTALAVGCNVLEAESLEAAREKVNATLGTCDILINSKRCNRRSNHCTGYAWIYKGKCNEGSNSRTERKSVSQS